MELSKGAAATRGSTELPRLNEMGLTKDQSSKFQQLANVPEEEFEDAINVAGARPSTHRILKSIKPEPEPETERINEDALFLLGRLMDFESRFFVVKLV